MFQACRRPPTSAFLVLTIIIFEALVAGWQFPLILKQKEMRVPCCKKSCGTVSDCVTDALILVYLRFLQLCLSSDVIKGLVKNGGSMEPFECHLDPSLQLFIFKS